MIPDALRQLVTVI